jgi:hypothetical protein
VIVNRWVSMLAASLMVVSCVTAQELKIDRPKPPAASLNGDLPDGWVKLDGGLARASFWVSNQFFSMPATALVAEKSSAARGILETMGVPFEAGADVSYDDESSMLTVTNTRAALEMTSVVISEHAEPSVTRTAIRTEIYEVTSLQALQLLESAASEFDHAPERAAIFEAVQKGSAQLIASHSLATRFGQRAKLGDIFSHTFKLDPAGDTTEFETVEVGTILECEPTTRYGGMISLNFALEHHTADPEMVKVPGGVIAPRFHSKRIQTNILVIDGGYKLIGTWRPTGKPEYSEKDVQHLVFVTASVQAE